MNTTAPLFNKETHRISTERAQAELYSRMFALMAEDFVTNSDIQTYLKLLTQALTSVQEQLDVLINKVANHTHDLPPHTHPLEPHTHACPSGGGPSGPNIGSKSTLSRTLATRIPVQSSTIKWNTVQIPQIQNTTNAVHNIGGSMIITGPTLEGPLFTGKRRSKPPEILNTTKTIPPLLRPQGSV